MIETAVILGTLFLALLVKACAVSTTLLDFAEKRYAKAAVLDVEAAAAFDKAGFAARLAADAQRRAS